MTDGGRGIDARLASSLASQVAPWNPTGGAGRIGFLLTARESPGGRAAGEDAAQFSILRRVGAG
jgi:hypothetical protein